MVYAAGEYNIGKGKDSGYYQPFIGNESGRFRKWESPFEREGLGKAGIK